MTDQIDLVELTKNRVRMLSGHVRGLEARAHFKLDELDKVSDEVLIATPVSLEAVTTSFVQGFFGRSFVAFGSSDDLLKHYKIVASDRVINDFKAGLRRLSIQRKLAGSAVSD